MQDAIRFLEISRLRAAAVLAGVVMAVGCSRDASSGTALVVTPTATVGSPAVLVSNKTQAAAVGAAFNYDATLGNAAFSDPRAKGLTYAVSFSPSANGLLASAGRISGTPTAPGVMTVTIAATDAGGASVSNNFSLVVFSAGLTAPSLPTTTFGYSDVSVPLPIFFTAANGGGRGGAGTVIATDNTTAGNAITDAGATLGRVLFYDKRLSTNDQKACGSCHIQAKGFSDTLKLSAGFAGGFTDRHSMGLTNARFYQRGRFFWDERSATLEAQVLQPIQNSVEMGMTLDKLITKLSVVSYYPALFTTAFGTPEITSDRISRALAQFVRSLTSTQSKFDRALAAGPQGFAAVFTQQELNGQQLFDGLGGCAACHGTAAHVSDNIHNNGLNLSSTSDSGAGGWRFKSPSLRNIAVSAPYMHDGRFATIAQVVEHYNSGVQANTNLDQRLRGPGGNPRRLNLTQGEKDALVAFLGTLTDATFLRDARLGSPFPRP
jgi:cytochrome c peroxidase